MKTFPLLKAILVLAALAQVGEAGLFDRVRCRKAAKRCDCVPSVSCAPTYQPRCCRPVIVRPSGTTVHTYQRQCSNLKPPSCDGCCPPAGCCPVGDSGSVGDSCSEAACCDTDGGCCPATGCDDCCPSVPCDNRCDLAQLIYESQTGCYARYRKRAVHRLSDRYDCICNPEVMPALIYAMNDADERVRAKAADEIGDQLRRYPCCCSEQVVSALTCALADCNWHVRFQAKQALKRCGYCIVDPCRTVGCCEMTCCPTCGAPTSAGGNEGVPTPETPADLPPGEMDTPSDLPTAEPVKTASAPRRTAPVPPSTFFPADAARQSAIQPVSAKRGLADLFGFDLF